MTFSCYFSNLDGSQGAPVLGEDGEPFGANHARTARRRAREAAERSGFDVLVLRGDRVAYVVNPAGVARPPSGMDVPATERCKRDEGLPGACFCRICRLSRKNRSRTA